MHPLPAPVRALQPSQAARALVEALTAALAVLLLLAAVPRAQAQQPPLQDLPPETPLTKMTPKQLAAQFNTPMCAARVRSGPCDKFYIRRITTMFVPVAFVEVTRTPGEAVVKSVALKPISLPMTGPTVSSLRSLTDNTWEAHVYVIPDRLYASSVSDPYLRCMPSEANLPDAESPAQSATLLSRAMCTGPLTEVVQQMQAVVTNVFNTAISEATCSPRPVYYSEVDGINWRTGCGDMTISNMIASNELTCDAADGLAKILDVTAPLQSIVKGDVCLDAWGPLYPRQMRERGLTGPVAAAKTAYRALSLARTSFGAAPFPVTKTGLMQQVYPTQPLRGACFPPGTSPKTLIETKTVWDYPRNGGNTFGFVYWQKAVCCTPRAAFGGCVI